MPIIFGLILVFVIWFQYEKRKVAKIEEAEKAAFIKRESAANLTRKKDISTLCYLTPNASDLPLTPGDDEVSNRFIETYLSYIDKKMVNLSHYSNTELKEQYGIANLSTLSEYDENFYSFVKLLNDWGLHLVSINQLTKAAKVLTLAVNCQSEITETYVTLAHVYQKQQAPEKIAALKAAFSSLSDTPSSTVLKQLDKAALDSLLESDVEIPLPDKLA